MSFSQNRRKKTITVTLSIELDEGEQNYIFDYSIERVFNNAIQNAEFVIKHATSDYDKERADINTQDWEDLKIVTTKLWNLVRNELFVHYNPEVKS